MSERARVTAIVDLLKKRFTNLTASECITLAYHLLDAIDEADRVERLKNLEQG